MGFAHSLHAWLNLGILHGLVNVQDPRIDTTFQESEDLDFARHIKQAPIMDQVGLSYVDQHGQSTTLRS